VSHFARRARRFLRKAVAQLTPRFSRSAITASCFPTARTSIRNFNARAESASICCTGSERLPRPLRTNSSCQSLDPSGASKAPAKQLKKSLKSRKYQPRGFARRPAIYIGLARLALGIERGEGRVETLSFKDTQKSIPTSSTKMYAYPLLTSGIGLAR
jgi:hypothetical protein